MLFFDKIYKLGYPTKLFIVCSINKGTEGNSYCSFRFFLTDILPLI